MTGGVVIGGLPQAAPSAQSPERDAEVLEFVLELERVQEAFYAQALESLRLDQEWRQFARVVGGQERVHRAFVEDALGGAAGSAPELDFSDLLTDQAGFAAAAVDLEDISVAAYNGQATNLTPETLAAAARIASVESRHAAWARDLASLPPAPLGSDRAVGAERARAQLAEAGLVP